MRNKEITRVSQGPTLLEQAYDAILGAICDGRLPPGERLNQDELAAQLQISRQPVGQALSLLRSQGFVRDNGRRGLIVAPLERDFFIAIYQLREALDPLAARLAAERCTPADGAEGSRILAEGRRALRAGNVTGLIDADMALHMWIYRVAGNSLLSETMRLYWNHLRRAMVEILRRTAERALVWDEHDGIVLGILEHDAKGAEKRALAHVRGAAERVAEQMSSTPASGSTPPETVGKRSAG